MKRPHPTIALLLWLTAAYAASCVGFLGVNRGFETQYVPLVRPGWAPPVGLFSFAGTIVSALSGFAAWRVWRAEGGGLWLWWTQLLLTALWPWLFFGFGKLGWALGEVAALGIALLATLVVSARTDRLAAWLLVPCLAWVGFTAVLNLAILRLN